MDSKWQEQIMGQTEARLRRLTALVYLLQALSLFTGTLTLFAGAIINYVRMQDVSGSWLESHFRWQTKTFWFGLLWLLIGGVTTIFLIGWLILLGVTLWLVYRIVKGWVLLSEQRVMPS